MKRIMICANCGNEFTVPENRFAVCGCGATDEYDKNGFYGLPESETIIKRYSGAECDEINLNDYDDAIPKLRCLPIANGANIRKDLLSALKEEEKLPGMELMKTWIVMSHVLHLRNSEMYRAFVRNRLYKCCNAVIYSGISRSTPINEANLISGVLRLNPNIPTEELDYAIDAIADGLPADAAETIARAHIDIIEFENMLKDTKISVYQALRDVSQFYTVAYRGSDIVDLITEYYDLMRRLKPFEKFGGTPNFSDDDPIYIRLFLARNTMRILMTNKVYTVRKLLDLYEEKRYDESAPLVVMSDGYVVRRMTAREVETSPLVMNLPKTGLTEAPIAIIKDNLIDSVFYFNHAGHVVLDGNCDDEHKKAANRYLDQTTKNEEAEEK